MHLRIPKRSCPYGVVYYDLRTCYLIAQQKLSYTKKQLYYGGLSSVA